MTVRIAPMTNADVDFAVAMTDAENWGYLRSDFERLVSLQPGGCFVARSRLRRVGMITTISHGDYSFMGTLIVKRNSRRHGVGEGLFSEAVGFLKRQGSRTIELDGVFAAAALYRRLGFFDKFLSLRFMRPANPSAVVSPVTPANVSCEEILRFDRAVVGLDRSAILSRLYQDFPSALIVADGEPLSGYAFVRPRAAGRLAIGPLVAANPETAARILKVILRTYSDRPLGIGVPQKQLGFVDDLIAAGFRFSAPSLRMYNGERLDIEQHVYGIVSPEKG
jgi:ribosomal protein S18 acetylase RimI-like enzyme